MRIAPRWRVAALLVVVGGAWLTFGKDATRDRIVNSVAYIADRAVSPRPTDSNWGDVAKKIGDFAAEERGLRESVSRAEKAAPSPGQ